MTIIINGSGSISGLSAGGLPDGSVTAGDLASTLDLTGKSVTLPSGVGGKVVGISTPTIYTNGASAQETPSQIGSTSIYYSNSLKISNTYTKQLSSSLLLVTFNYNYNNYGSASGLHSLVVWKDASNFRGIVHDIQRACNASSSAMSFSSTAVFDGLSTGSHTFNVAPARWTGDTISHSRNVRNNSDQIADQSLHSWIYITEVAV
jgi:hypothetical protein